MKLVRRKVTYRLYPSRKQAGKLEQFRHTGDRLDRFLANYEALMQERGGENDVRTPSLHSR
jgi:hypothetical protein